MSATADRVGRTEGPEPIKLPEGTVILVVDDVSDIQDVLKYFLEYQGAIVLTADKGSEAIELALREKPSLVLMDMMLAGDMSGYVATRELRNHGFGEPIIAMTGGADQWEREKCFRAGCSDYLKKPLDLKQLLHTVARHL